MSKHLINFKKEFASYVEQGFKTQTIRKSRKRPIEEGHTLKLYTGLRTKECKLLGEAICHKKIGIYIQRDAILLGYKGAIRVLQNKEIEELAKADGFQDIESFFDFFRSHYGLPFAGNLIKW